MEVQTSSMSSWLAEDPELLRAALEIIETWDDDGNASDTTSISVRSPLTDGGSDSATDEHEGSVELDDSASEDGKGPPNASGSLIVTMRLPSLDVKKLDAKESVAVATRGLKPSTVASTRHRRREEIIYLRDKVKEMEAQLSTLEKIKKEDNAAGNEETNADKTLAVMWHDIASRQQRMRQKSELDQAKLRKLLETQVKVAEGLMKLMQKARRLEEDEAFPQVKRMRVTNGPSSRLDEGEQLARIHAHYENLDEAFAFHKFHDGTTKFVDIEVTDELEEEVIIEYREAWTVPFEVDCVLGALWEYTLKKNQEKWCQPDHHASTTMRLDGTELVSRFSATSTVCGFTGSFNGQVIVKQFARDGEKPAAIITSMRTDPDPVNPGDVAGFYMHDDAWIRVQPVNQAAYEIGGKAITSVQCTQRFRMRFEEDAQKARQASGALTNMILDKLKDDIELKHNTVESLLLCSRSR